METPEQRQEIVDFVRTLTEATPVTPSAYELMLLNRFIYGILTLEQIDERLTQYAKYLSANAKPDAARSPDGNPA